ncbi:acyl-CoA dehydrogenase family protein [Gammaproteobacteria bacterium]|jgi:alkylation response protein AidB-like acyl-CoA dehydrogenase|nr:acyl-CoA dehydrogenase family protein [Gammaproteobacteria bacterium]MDB9997822.1 acyl-CoA dehydrogenase family protein [bacterium]MDA8934240.1 acyl-CoA dehydrogenase family protein [Gammaproteobacteria bacterium]MDA9039876.1 acyl-CoA dehydrogenase family protein [Gammaproteobacteria bacterium]MDA9266121.1 acyl-CoA dehydrogenase family protein [Gammaproteobacteria bacterium]|tara:strand:- start:330 stop:1553 length:1224 start_codon:yes stop_codon:yes gene_type:complete
MDLNYGPEYEDFRKEVQEFCKKWDGVNFTNAAKVPMSMTFKETGKTISRSEWQSILIDQGYFARSVPKEYGGFGGDSDVIKNRIIASEFSNAKIPPAMGGQGIDMLVPTLLELGTEDQKKQYIKPTLHGEMIWCQGYSEPNAGSDLASLQTKGELIDGNWVINGQKIWTSTAQYSQMMFCLVRTEPDAQKHAGISYLLIPMNTAGLEVRPLIDMTLKSGFNEVFFTDVTIPQGNIIGKRGEGWAVANATLGHERGSLTNPNATVNRVNSLIDRMKEETLDGRRLIDMPVYRDKLMALQAKVMAFQSNSLRVLSSKLNKGQDTKIAGMIQKLVGTELRHELEGFAVDVMGEIGTLYEDSPNLRDNGSWQFLYMYYLGLIIGGGTSQIQKNIISERGLGMPREPKVQGV